ncbi:hypothetical protein Tco_0294981 [Tanacetum coccineum]
MPPIMTTRNAGRRTAASRGGRTGGQTHRGGGRTSDQGGRGNETNGGVDEVPDFSTVIAQQLQDLLPTIVAQVGDHISNQGINGSQNDNTADDSIHEDIRNVNMSNSRNECSKKEFVACKPKEFDGKGGAIAYTHWVKKTEAVQDISSCGDNQKVKYSTAGHAVYTDRFHKLARLVPHLVTPETKRIDRYIYSLTPQIRRMVASTEPHIIQNAILKAGVLTDEAVRNRSLKKSGEKRGNGRESSKEGNVKGDNKRARTRKAFAIVTDVLSCRTKNEEKDLTCKRIPLNELMVVI